MIACTMSLVDASASSSLGRATYYGAGDGFTLNDGSCACHKQDVKSSWLNSRCENGYCFDYIGAWSFYLCQDQSAAIAMYPVQATSFS